MYISPITQTEKFNKTSDKYKLIQTDNVIEVFQDNGLQLSKESIANVRNKDKLGFQKHLLTFTRDDLRIGDEQLQLLLLNSHDGTSSFQLSLGVFRFVCSNGLVVGEKAHEVRVKHTGNCLDKLNIAIPDMLEQMPKIAERIAAFKEVELSPEQRKQFIFDAAELRIGDSIYQVGSCNPQRTADLNTDLWTVFNRVQEYVIRGGMRYTLIDKDGKVSDIKRTRALTSIDKTVKLNKQLWELAEGMAA